MSCADCTSNNKYWDNFFMTTCRGRYIQMRRRRSYSIKLHLVCLLMILFFLCNLPGEYSNLSIIDGIIYYIGNGNKLLSISSTGKQNSRFDVTFYGILMEWLGLHKKARARGSARARIGLELIWLELKWLELIWLELIWLGS
jgi:hypothetical protein